MKIKYIFCDESRYLIDDKTDQYMVLGALWIDGKNKNEIKEKIKTIIESFNYKSEVKWSNLSVRRFNLYKELISLVKKEKINVRVEIIDKTKIDLQKYHNDNEELSHTKFIYLLLRDLVADEDTSNIIILDYKDRDSRIRLKELKRILAINCPPTSRITQLQESVSHENYYLQIIDLIIGAVGYDVNNINKSESKIKLCDHIKKTFKISSFLSSSKRDEVKFNIFNIKLL